MIEKQATQVTPGKRRYARAAVEGYIGEIAAGNLVLSGVVDNVSHAGLRMSGLPAGFSVARSHYVAVVSGYDKKIKIIVRPRWFNAEDSDHMAVGFKIIDAPWEWMMLVSTEIPDYTN